MAEDDQEILGYCGVLTVLDEGDITNVAVRKDRQGEGIGKLLVQELIRKASDAGVTTIHLEVRESNTRRSGCMKSSDLCSLESAETIMKNRRKTVS